MNEALTNTEAEKDKELAIDKAVKAALEDAAKT